MMEDRNLLTKAEWAVFMSGPPWTSDVEAAFDSDRTRDAYDLHLKNIQRSREEVTDSPRHDLNTEGGR